MEENAYVCWAFHDEPRVAEEHLISTLCLPLNLEGNTHPFGMILSSLRRAARTRAIQLPIWSDG
jgi:hypothetical protein